MSVDSLFSFVEGDQRRAELWELQLEASRARPAKLSCGGLCNRHLYMPYIVQYMQIDLYELYKKIIIMIPNHPESP